jgi:hypothetical protein
MALWKRKKKPVTSVQIGGDFKTAQLQTDADGDDLSPKSFISKLDELLNILPRLLSMYILCVIFTMPGCTVWFVHEEMSNMGFWADIRQAIGASLLFSILWAFLLRYGKPDSKYRVVEWEGGDIIAHFAKTQKGQSREK